MTRTVHDGGFWTTRRRVLAAWFALPGAMLLATLAGAEKPGAQHTARPKEVAVSKPSWA